MLKYITLVLVLAFGSGCSPKSSFDVTDLVIREMAPGRDVGVAYLSIENLSAKNLNLNYVHSPRTDVIEVHRHLYEDGMMKMRQVKHVSIDPNSTLDFTPGGFHLMLFGVDKPFQQGESVELTFEFENYPPQVVVASVKRL